MYPSSLIITPDPSAVAVDWLREKIELTEYSTLIPTIEGKTFWATFLAINSQWSKVSVINRGM